MDEQTTPQTPERPAKEKQGKKRTRRIILAIVLLLILLCKDKTISARLSGNRYLIALEDVVAYFNGESQNEKNFRLY